MTVRAIVQRLSIVQPFDILEHVRDDGLIHFPHVAGDLERFLVSLVPLAIHVAVPKVLLSDTVGFIKNLPHGLVASFKSTLDEALDASLLLHIVDASDSGFERQLYVTNDVLHEIEADAVPRLLVFNKIDHVGAGGNDSAAQAECEAALRAQYPDCIVMSAKRADDVAALHKKIAGFFKQDLVEAELFLPWSRQQLRGEIFATCEVVAEHANDEGAIFTVRGAQKTVDGLREQLALAG